MMKLVILLLTLGPVSAFAETKEFSNGCTRTCTGSWTYNSGPDTFTCNGVAGSLDCGGSMGHTVLLRQAPQNQGTIFSSNGSAATNAGIFLKKVTK